MQITIMGHVKKKFILSGRLFQKHIYLGKLQKKSSSTSGRANKRGGG